MQIGLGFGVNNGSSGLSVRAVLTGAHRGASPTSELMVVELSGRGGALCPPADSLLSSLLKMD